MKLGSVDNMAREVMKKETQKLAIRPLLGDSITISIGNSEKTSSFSSSMNRRKEALKFPRKEIDLLDS